MFKNKWLVSYLIATLIKMGTLIVIIVNGHPNIIRICSYKTLANIIIMLEQNARASTHLVA
jgi:hypothetical protein